MWIFTLVISSCTDFIDREPYSEISSDNFYNTEAKLDLAVVGLYGTLQDIYRSDYVLVSDLPADDSQDGNGGTSVSGELDKFSVSTTNNTIERVWILSYKSILQTNKILEALSEVDFVETEKKEQIQGEALFVRALNYFNLVRIFGKVPLEIKPISQVEARQSTRAEVSDVYNLIIEDLESASLLLPKSYSGNNIGRVTSWAALSLLGKVYLTAQRFEEAITPLQNVVQNGPFKLLDDYAAIFDPKNANHEESIFEIQYEGGTLDEGSQWGFKAHNRSLAVPLGISAGAQTMPTADIINLFKSGAVGEENSPRFLATIGNTEGVNHVKKHYMELAFQNQSDDNWPLIRYADILLMYAEVLNETSATPTEEAIEYVNQIRRRAFGLPTNQSDPSIDLDFFDTEDQSTFRETIYLERRLELAFEGHRWFDLVRTNRYVSVMNTFFESYNNGIYKVESYHKLFPLPQRELDINPLLKPNNDGYN